MQARWDRWADRHGCLSYVVGTVVVLGAVLAVSLVIGVVVGLARLLVE